LKGLSRVSFKAGNWLQMKCASNKYEVITCFSVTKWIHLNWGDDGLMKLFHKFHRWGKATGTVYIFQCWLPAASPQLITHVGADDVFVSSMQLPR